MDPLPEIKVDVDDLKDCNLSPEFLESTKQARIEAKSIIEAIDPRYISSWPDLMFKLKEKLEDAKRNQQLFTSRAIVLIRKK